MSPFKSFIGNMMTSGTGASGAGDIFRQMFLAMMQGKSPQEFMKNLAKTNPQLQGLDLSNLEKTGKDLCQKNDKDPNEMFSKAQEAMKNNI